MNTFIFDIGNVLIDYTPIDMVKRAIGDHPDALFLAQELFSRYYWDKLDLDEMTIEDVKKDIKNVIPPHLYDLADLILDKWLDIVIPVKGIEDVLSLLKEKGFKLYYLSNLCSQFIKEGYDHPHIKNILDL